ncbi:MAG: hypothetical protein ACRDGA_09000 [Bacteroidota bacterium]
MDLAGPASQVAEWFHPLKVSYTDTVLTIRKESWPYLLLPMAIIEGMVIASFFNSKVTTGVLIGIILFIPFLVILIGRSFSYVITVDKKKKIILVVERSLFLKSSKQITLDGFDCLTLDGEETNRIWKSPESLDRKIVVSTRSGTTTILSTNRDHAYEIIGYLNEFLFEEDDSSVPHDDLPELT